MHKRIVVTALVVLAATGCQKKASGQTVAVVNNQEITASDLNAALASDPAAAAAGPQQARQAELQKLIDRTLLVQQAKSDGIDKSPEYLNRLRLTTDELLMNMLLSRKMNTSQLPSASEISSFETSHPQMFANREVWTLSQIIYPMPKNQAVNAKLAASKSLDEVAQILTSSGIQFTRNTRKFDTAIFPDAIYTQVAHVPAGNALHRSWPDKCGRQRHHCSRAKSPLSPDQAQALAVNAMRRGTAEQGRSRPRQEPAERSQDRISAGLCADREVRRFIRLRSRA